MSRPRSKRSSRRSPLVLLSGFVTRRAPLVVGIWIALLLVLGGLGKDLDRKLTSHPLFIDGTQTKRAHEIAEREFGSDYSMVVMLRGPSEQVERQGRELAFRLGAMPHSLVISPWARGATVGGLRPSPDVVGLVVRVEADGFDQILPPVRREVNRTVKQPVRASLAGFPVIIDSLYSSSERATKIGELVAVPVLLLVLLLVFRSVFAALLPVIIGGAVVGATRGLLTMLLGVVQLDLFTAGAVGMVGLALGVDYSLLVVSRFREEYKGGDVAEAVQATVRATSRSVIPAGSGLLFAMFAALLLLPGGISLSVSIALATTTVLSMLSAICVVPAILMLGGRNLDRWSWPARGESRIAPLRWSRRIAAHPRAVVGIMLMLLFCSGLALTLRSAVASVALLPGGDAGRREQETVQDGLGPGWLAPMEVVMDGRGSPVTSTERLKALADFQRQVERDPGVETMAGLAAVQKGAEQLSGVEGQLASQERGLDRLETGISRLHSGAVRSGSGLLAAAAGSRGLNSGIGAVNEGVGALAGGLQATSVGSSRLSRGLGRADDGSGKLEQGTTKASAGAGRLVEGLTQAEEQTGELQSSARLFKNAMRSGEERLAEVKAPLEGTEAQLAAAWQALQRMTTGRSDPAYAAALAAVEEASKRLTGKDIATGEPSDPPSSGVAEGVERADGQFGVGTYLASKLERNGESASKGMSKLSHGAARLVHGIDGLQDGSRQVSRGIAALNRGGEALSPALERLSAGAERLAGGVDKLQTGSGRLVSGLSSGAEGSKRLTGGLRRIEAGLESKRGGDGGSQFARVRQRSPGLFRSSYFILAGLDGSKPERRRQLGTLINLDHGGMDARMLVIPRDEPTTAAAGDAKTRLEEDAEDLAQRTGTEVVVGGAAPLAIDANDALRGEAPLLRLALSLVSMVILIPVMRSLTMPIIAALLNLVAVSASFGLLSVLFGTSLLGGPGYVDASVLPAGMIVMFGLAIDYEVFVFARIREEYVRTGSTRAAVDNGLDRVAHVVTGAALIMISVFLAFSVSDFMSIRNFGVAQAIAVFIDAFIVRLIFVPAIMRWLGPRCWWLPRWLDRLLPGSSPVPVDQRAG